MEFDGVTFPDVWGRYFEGSSPFDYVLFVHVQNARIPATMDHDARARSGQPDLFPLPASWSEDVSRNVRIWRMSAVFQWGHPMLVLLEFWRHAVADDDVAGLMPLNGSCLPMKPFSHLRRAFFEDRRGKLADHSVLNWASERRTKAFLGGYLTQRAASEMVAFEGGGPIRSELLPGGRLRGAVSRQGVRRPRPAQPARGGHLQERNVLPRALSYRSR